MSFRYTAIAAALLATQASAADTDNATPLPLVQVTATRDAEPVDNVPASISVISGDEIRARGANDLRTALSLVAGVEGTPTGDAGPAGSVPALWGLREVDSFLLVVDGVPVGGAFNPITTSVDLTGVERIEIVRGAAPVMFGATSFNGVIHIIHYAAGETPATLSVGAGQYQSVGAALTTNLAGSGAYKQSLTANIDRTGFSVDRQNFNRYHLLYRGAERTADGGFHVDAEVSILPQSPGSVTFRNGGKLRTDLIPADANHNPADAKMDEKHVQLNAGFDRRTGLGNWTTTLSLARTTNDIVRGYLRDDAPATDASGNDADGYTQRRQITDAYFDTHISQTALPSVQLTYGLDYMYGRGRQNAVRFGYFSALDGSAADSSGMGDVTETAHSENVRNFGGLYAQADWKAGTNVDVLAGLRLNQTREQANGEGSAAAYSSDERTKTRPSGTVGASWHVYRDGADSLTVYTDYRNTYKPLAWDFAPTPDSTILQPETSSSYEVGAKGELADGRLSYDLSVFQLDMRNLKTLDTAGNTVNAGQSRFTGAEMEARYRLIDALTIAGSYAYHDSRLVHFNRDGTPGGVVDGNRFETAPFHLASLGLLYTPPQGFNATLVSSFTGERVLNKSNSLSVGGFTTLDASIGYQFGAYGVHINGYNLTDRRDPIAESELSGEISGASSYYRMPGRRVMANFTASF